MITLSMAFLISGHAVAQVVDDTASLVDQHKLKNVISNLSKDLKDPSSLQIRNLHESKSQPQNILCGEYNAKNSFGGYVGYSKFIASPDSVMSERNNQFWKIVAPSSGCF